MFMTYGTRVLIGFRRIELMRNPFNQPEIKFDGHVLSQNFPKKRWYFVREFCVQSGLVWLQRSKQANYDLRRPSNYNTVSFARLRQYFRRKYFSQKKISLEDWYWEDLYDQTNIFFSLQTFKEVNHWISTVRRQLLKVRFPLLIWRKMWLWRQDRREDPGKTFAKNWVQLNWSKSLP